MKLGGASGRTMTAARARLPRRVRCCVDVLTATRLTKRPMRAVVTRTRRVDALARLQRAEVAVPRRAVAAGPLGRPQRQPPPRGDMPGSDSVTFPAGSGPRLVTVIR